VLQYRFLYMELFRTTILKEFNLQTSSGARYQSRANYTPIHDESVDVHTIIFRREIQFHNITIL